MKVNASILQCWSLAGDNHAPIFACTSSASCAVGQARRLAGSRSGCGHGWPCRYDVVSKAGVPNPRAHLEGLFPGGLALAGAYVAPGLIEQLDTAAEEALESSGWADCAPLAPAALSGGDAAELVARCPAVQALGEGLGFRVQGCRG